MAIVVVGLVLLLALAIAVGAARSAIRKHGAGTLLIRWLTGHSLDGRDRTNAGWLEPGTRALTATGRASRWHHRPRAYRAAWRTSGTLGVLLAGYGLIADRGATELAMILGAAASLGWGGVRAWWAIGEGRHTRRWVRPLHLALAGPIGVAVAARPRSWLTVPRDYAGREGAEIRINFPEGFALGGESSKAQITEIVTTKLALEQPRAAWHLAGRNPHVIYTVDSPPPDKVSYASMRDLIAAAKDTAPLIGMGRSRKPVDADLDSDSPHILLSMGSGAGKSVAARAFVAQILNRGGVALFLDVKRLSHAWARGLPNVRYARDAAEIHEALLWLREELDRRNRLADEGSDIDGNTDSVDVGPRIIVVCEEMNATIQRLTAYWRQIRDRDDPTTSPAIEALADAAFMGRQSLCNLLLIAQMLTARAVGGPEIRENAGVRILGRYTVNNARMLCPEIWPFPKSSRKPGRVQVCIGGKARETQVMLMTPAEARELATSGTVSQFPGTSGAGQQQREPMRPTAIRLHVVRPADEPIGLRQAIADGVIPVPDGSTPERTLANVRKAKQYDPEFPAPVGGAEAGQEHVYDPASLASWARNRPRAAKAAGELCADRVPVIRPSSPRRGSAPGSPSSAPSYSSRHGSALKPGIAYGVPPGMNA